MVRPRTVFFTHKDEAKVLEPVSLSGTAVGRECPVCRDTGLAWRVFGSENPCPENGYYECQHCGHKQWFYARRQVQRWWGTEQDGDEAVAMVLYFCQVCRRPRKMSVRVGPLGPDIYTCIGCDRQYDGWEVL